MDYGRFILGDSIHRAYTNLKGKRDDRLKQKKCSKEKEETDGATEVHLNTRKVLKIKRQEEQKSEIKGEYKGNITRLWSSNIVPKHSLMQLQLQRK